MKYRLLVVFFFLSILVAYSYNAKFYSVNSTYGISLRETASICQDKSGFVWTASKNGILRLAENDYRIYQLPYESADVINVKLVYSNSVLLAYANNGQIFKYNALNDRFDFIVNLSRVLKNKYINVTRVIVDDQGTLWIATSFGFYRYQQGRLTLIDKDEVSYIERFDSDHLFLTKSKGIWLMNIHTLKRDYLYQNKTISPFQVSKLYFDKRSNRLWIGTMSNGLYHFDIKSRIFSGVKISAFPKQPVLAIEANTDTTLLVGIDGQGIWKLNRRGDRVLDIYKENTDDPFSIKGDGVYDIFCDRNKRVWVSTYSDGLSFFEQVSPLVRQITHTVNNPNSLSHNNVNRIIQDRNGNVWFATNNGISCLETATGRWRVYYQNKQEQAKVFLTLCEDNQGRIWAGTYSSGVYVIDSKSGQELAHYSSDGQVQKLPSNFIFDIFKDSQGDIWIGGVQGEVCCYLSSEGKFRKYAYFPVNVFKELSPGKILMACTFGVVLLDKNTGKTETLLEGLLVQDIFPLKGDLWVCTCGEGLIHYNLKSRKIEKFTTKSGLPSNCINSLLYAEGYFWLGTEGGLCRLNPKNNSVMTYTSILPLSKVSFNRNSNCKLNDGQLAWGTNYGAVIFEPIAIQPGRVQGKIFFQDLTISGRSIRSNSGIKLNTPLDSLQEISLNYNQNTLTLDLLPIGVGAGAKFSWMLEGLDKVWSQPSENHFLNYSNIPSGDYVLKIRLYDSSQSNVLAERSVILHIVPPFWKTWWFRLLLFALIVGIIYFTLNYYIERLKQQHTEEKVRFFTNTAHDIRTSLTLIKAPIEELTKEVNLSDLGRQYLSLATEQARRLSTVVTQLMDFQKVDIGKEQIALSMVDIVALVEHRRLMFESFAKSKNVNLQFAADQECYQTAIDESMMEKVIDNLISNAIKYSHPDHSVQIELKCSPESWTLEVKDQGIGISKKAQRQLFREFYRGENAINSKIVGSGIGLLLVKNYVSMHGGEINCESQENAGSIFRIVIPFKEVSEEEKADKAYIQDSQLHFVPENTEKPGIQEDEQSKREMRILIVEDNDDLRTFMQYPLQADFEVLLAEDGVQAWDIIQKQMPDLVVSDVMMPNMDGFELCRLMKSTYETSHIPLILLTALSGKAEQLHGLGLGADDYLTKPFDMTLLVHRIKSIIRNRQAVKEKALKLIKVIDNKNEQILTNELNDKFVKRMLEVVKDNMANTEFGKDDFAAAMNVSASLLYKKIKALTDQSPTDFIKTVRLDYALELLQSRKISVTEVSELCGFSTIGYFSTVFKKHFGKSPTEI